MITRADISGSKAKLLFHAHIQGGAIWGYQCVDHPRLCFADRYDARSRATTRNWTVDNQPYPDIDAAIAALNGEPPALELTP